jgi:hypothetical protein
MFLALAGALDNGTPRPDSITIRQREPEPMTDCPDPNRVKPLRPLPKQKLDKLLDHYEEDSEGGGAKTGRC